MKQLILLTTFLIMLMCAEAQHSAGNSITGTVMNAETKKPLEYATVTLFVQGEKKPLTGTTTDNTGSFTLTDIPAGRFSIVIETIGFESFNQNDLVINKKDGIIDLKKILLASKKTTLQGVTIVAPNKLVENKIDKMIFNAEKDVSSQGGVATDVLKKVPQVSVDADGNVELAGNGGIRFLINGKPSSAFGSNIAAVLQSIPASQIKSIEVITNPGAKYDAQGMGGIINIILKNNNAQGYNGNVSLTAGTRNENGSLNLNMRKNTFGMNAFLSGNKRLRSATGNVSNRVTTDSGIISTLNQTGGSHFDREGYQSGMGFDWTYKKLNSFSGNIAYNHFGFNGNGTTNQVLQPDKGGAIADIISSLNSGNKYTYHSIDASLNYKRTFAKEDQELEAAISKNNGNNRGQSFTEQFSMPQDVLYYGTNGVNPAKTTETILSVDYTQPLNQDVKWGIGGKTTLYNIESNAAINSYNAALQNYRPDAFLSNGLSYKQRVYAAYSELTFPVAKLFDVKLGGRYERTVLNAWYSNVGKVALPSYNTFVPSIYLSKKLQEGQTLKLSFSKRIQRPGYDELNPFVNTTDPKNLSTGNPFLKPETGYRIEFGYNRDLGKQGSFMANLFYRINDNDIQPYIVYYPTYLVGDSLYTNVSVNTRSNIGRENNMGLNLFTDLHITSKLNIRNNLFLFYRHTINQIDKGYNTNSFNYRVNMNASYQFTNSVIAEFFGNFSAARHEAQGRYPSFTSYTMALRKQFWKKKGSVALTATNPFSENLKQKTILTGPNFTVNGERTIPFRSIGINFTWKFGKLEFKKKNEENSDPGLNASPQ